MTKIIPVLLMVHFASVLFAQSLPTIQPDVGMSTERLGRIDDLFQQYVDEDRIPGAVALVMRRGKIVHFKAYGWGGYWYTEFTINPEEEMVIIFMSNLKLGHRVDLDKKLLVLAYQAIME